MTDAEKVHRILYLGILEMRAYSAANKEAYAMGSFLHGIPHLLDKVASGKMTYSEVLAGLAEFGEWYHCDRWLQANLEQMESRGTESN